MQRAVFRVTAVGLLLALGILGHVSVGWAATSELKLVTEIPKGSQVDGKAYPPEYHFQAASQSFRQGNLSQGKDVDPKDDPQLKAFFEIVKKEPAYVSEHPFKGVIEFAGKKFAFAFDVIPEEKPQEDKVKEDGDANTKAATEQPVMEEEEEIVVSPATKSGEKAKPSASAKGRVKIAKNATLIKTLGIVPAKPESQYNRLYLDRNNNGDLTDDEPIKVGMVESGGRPRYQQPCFVFSLPIEQGDKTVEIPCRFYASSAVYVRQITTPGGEKKQVTIHSSYAHFMTTCFREGEIRLGDNNYRVILIDANGNGLFNDMAENVMARKTGDTLFIFPSDLKKPQFAYSPMYGKETEVKPLFVGPMIGEIEGKIWNLTITPFGDRITLEPFDKALGYVEKSGKLFSLTVFNKEAKTILCVASDKTGKAALPAGSWDMLACSVTFEREKTDAEMEAEIEEAAKAVSAALAAETARAAKEAAEAKEAAKNGKAVKPRRKAALPRPAGDEAQAPISKVTKGTALSLVYGKKDVTLKIVENKTIDLPLGPPYKVAISCEPSTRQNRGPLSMRLSLAMTGASGERCAGVYIDGKRPPKPTFVITTKDGKEVESGAFEYG